jgi:solute carrier family 30 (zinc transporter), member 9
MEKETEEIEISGFFPVALAIGGNAFITVIKFIGFWLSGSGSLFSEAVHSFADTLNQSLLMIGIRKSLKKPNKEFAYGFGQERFIWALISACGIFFIGSGVTVYHGIMSLLEKKEIFISPVIFIILAVSFVVETCTLITALWELKKHSQAGILESIREGDPSTVAVVFEDGVAVLGVFVAFLGIVLTSITHNYYWDSIGSITIGIMLGIIAIVLINKNREYLTRKSIPEDKAEKIIAIIESDPTIEKVIDFKSSILDVGKYRIKCEVEFNGHAMIKELSRNGFIRNEYEVIKNDYNEFLRFCVDYMDRVPRLIGSRIDKIEKKIQKKFPEVKHIDIEIN